MKNIKAVLFDLDSTLFPYFKVSERIKIAKMTLQKIKRLGYKVGVVSNCNLHEALDKIKTIGIKKFVNIIVTPENVYNKKPMRKMFFKAAKKLDVEPFQTLFVGDRLIHDIWGPKLCGMKTVLIKEKLKIYHKLILSFKPIFGPDFVVSDLKEVLDVLRRL
jgi:putative hydrolase of the HAD superfamily